VLNSVKLVPGSLPGIGRKVAKISKRCSHKLQRLHCSIVQNFIPLFNTRPKDKFPHQWRHEGSGQPSTWKPAEHVHQRIDGECVDLAAHHIADPRVGNAPQIDGLRLAVAPAFPAWFWLFSRNPRWYNADTVGLAQTHLIRLVVAVPTLLGRRGRGHLKRVPQKCRRPL